MNRRQGTGNSWAVPVVRWIGERLWNVANLEDVGIDFDDFGLVTYRQRFGEVEYYGFDRKVVRLADGRLTRRASPSASRRRTSPT